jgi:GxxExxY protein
MKDVEALARLAIDHSMAIHKDLGPGLLESAYESILAASLARAGIKVDRQQPVRIRYAGLQVADAFRIDLLVENHLILEIKSVERLAPVHSRQLLTYLRLADLPLGLLMNFGGATFREGLKRIVNDYHAPAFPPRDRADTARP